MKGQKGTGDGSDYASLILYADRFEDLPIIQRVGDVIRVHRACLRTYDHHRQFNASLHFFSSWALFSPDDNQNVPYSYSGKKYAFEK